MNEKILTSNEKKPILKLTIREFRNHISTYWPLVVKGAIIVIYNKRTPILIVSSYKK